MTEKSEEIVIHLLDMPYGVNEIVSPNEDGTYSVFINAKLSIDGRSRAYKHAFRHIMNADFAGLDVQSIEYGTRDTPNPSKTVWFGNHVRELLKSRRC